MSRLPPGTTRTIVGVSRFGIGAAALGPLAYGVYQLVESRYRRIDVA